MTIIKTSNPPIMVLFLYKYLRMTFSTFKIFYTVSINHAVNRESSYEQWRKREKGGGDQNPTTAVCSAAQPKQLIV